MAFETDQSNNLAIFESTVLWFVPLLGGIAADAYFGRKALILFGHFTRILAMVLFTFAGVPFLVFPSSSRVIDAGRLPSDDVKVVVAITQVAYAINTLSVSSISS